MNLKSQPISSSAGHVLVQVGGEEWTCLSFLDDGCSLDPAELKQAVKFDPPQDHHSCKTSRFGEGMKAAAFWLASESHGAIFLFALKGAHRSVVLMGGNSGRDLDMNRLAFPLEFSQGDGERELLAVCAEGDKARLQETIGKLCRQPSRRGCAGNSRSPFDGVQDIAQVSFCINHILSAKLSVPRSCLDSRAKQMVHGQGTT